MMIYRDLIVLIIAFTCVGVFVATAIASVLDLFNLLKLAADIQKKLHTVLIVGVVGIAVAAFGGFLNPKPIVEKVEDQKTRLEKQIIDSTKEIFTRGEGYAQKPRQPELEWGFLG
jgi:NAD/NADP transhydrogenase alpha subunit